MAGTSARRWSVAWSGGAAVAGVSSRRQLQRASARGASGSSSSIQPTRSSPKRSAEPRQLPAEPARSARLRREERELRAGGRRHVAELQLQARHRRPGRGRLEAGDQQPLDGQPLRSGLGQRLVYRRSRAAASPAENERSSSRVSRARAVGRSAGLELIAERRGQPVQHEAQRSRRPTRAGRSAGPGPFAPGPGAAGTAPSPRRAPGHAAAPPPARTGPRPPSAAAPRPGR